MCHLVIVEFGACGHKSLARHGCSLNNAGICEDERNQVIDYHHDQNSKCENCIINLLYRNNMSVVSGKYAAATDEERVKLKQDATKKAMHDVSPLKSEKRKNMKTLRRVDCFALEGLTEQFIKIQNRPTQ